MTAKDAFKIILVICLIIIAINFFIGCAACNGKVFLGWGKYKDSDFEIESSPPISLPKVDL